MALQSEVSQLRAQIKTMEDENQSCLGEWKQIQEWMQERINELESQEPTPGDSPVVAELESSVEQLRREIEAEKEVNEKLDVKLKKALSDIKEQQQQKKDQALKIAKAAKESMMQANEEKKQIKEM